MAYVGAVEIITRIADPTLIETIYKTHLSPNVMHVRVEGTGILPPPQFGTAPRIEEFFEYAYRDHLGSVEVVTDENGTVLDRMAYEPFGQRKATDWASNAPVAAITALIGADWDRTPKARGFTGHEHLDRTGFIHMNGRVYDPELGRFLSPDPLVPRPSLTQSWNRYSYVRNSPASLIDPSGFQDDLPTDDGFEVVSEYAAYMWPARRYGPTALKGTHRGGGGRPAGTDEVGFDAGGATSANEWPQGLVPEIFPLTEQTKTQVLRSTIPPLLYPEGSPAQIRDLGNQIVLAEINASRVSASGRKVGNAFAGQTAGAYVYLDEAFFPWNEDQFGVTQGSINAPQGLPIGKGSSTIVPSGKARSDLFLTVISQAKERQQSWHGSVIYDAREGVYERNIGLNQKPILVVTPEAVYLFGL